MPDPNGKDVPPPDLGPKSGIIPSRRESAPPLPQEGLTLPALCFRSGYKDKTAHEGQVRCEEEEVRTEAGPFLKASASQKWKYGTGNTSRAASGALAGMVGEPDMNRGSPGVMLRSGATITPPSNTRE